MIAGAMKLSASIAAHGRQAVLQDYLALRCSGGAPAAPEASLADPAMSILLHCWGCYALLAGLLLLLAGLNRFGRVHGWHLIGRGSTLRRIAGEGSMP